RNKMVIGVLLIMAVGAASIAWALQQSYQGRIDQAAKDSVASAESAFTSIQRGRTEKLFALLDALTSDAALTGAFADRDREELAALTKPRFDLLKERQGLTRWYFYLPESEGTVFLRAYKGDDALDPAEYGDETSRATYWQAVESQGPVSGFELGKTALALRAAQPHPGSDGSVIGYMAVGEEIGDFLALAAEQTGDEYAFFLDKASFEEEDWAAAREKADLENDWGRFPDALLADATFEDEDLLDLEGAVAAVPEDGVVLSQESLNGKTNVRGAFPVYEAGGEKVGAVLVLRDITGQLEQMRSAQNSILALIAVLVVAVAVVIILMLNTLIFKRLKAMIVHMEELGLRIAGGDFRVPQVEITSSDEIGEFERFFTDFLSIMATTLERFSGQSPKD
ncbi:MAG: cache domain-containing protein, partial [Actinomycetota bacterium]|nr:cache domain-containing protein [Actinomycetota bacterium]